MSAQQNTFLTSDSGATAVEFALVLPGLAMLIVGTLYAGLVMYTVAGLHTRSTAVAVAHRRPRPTRKASITVWIIRHLRPLRPRAAIRSLEPSASFSTPALRDGPYR
jgi:Flp pilus assembly pilin Flp